MSQEHEVFFCKFRQRLGRGILRTVVVLAVVVLALVVLALASAGPSAVFAGCLFSQDKTPATGVPQELWGDLTPGDLGQLGLLRDNTAFDQLGSFEDNPYTTALDVENGWVFVARNRRFEIWDARTVPNLPTRTFDLGFTSAGLTWVPDGHANFLFHDVDAPRGNADIVALAGHHGIGMAVYDTSDKASAALLYQDHGNGRWADQVYAAAFGGREYAFIAAGSTLGRGGVFGYDLSAAAALTTPCIEAQPGGTSPCPGIFLGPVGSRSRVSSIDGAGSFVVFSSGFSPEGFEIWNVADPTQPVLVMDALATERVYGVAMWQEGQNFFVAANVGGSVKIYEVSCITGGSCSPTLLSSQPAEPNAPQMTVTFSRSGTTPFIYFGSTIECLSGFQHEWLFDVSTPRTPRDVTPPATAVIGGQEVSYWGWYYWDNGVHGFNHVAPRMGKFSGEYFYRAGHSIFDVHRWQDLGGIFLDGFESGDTSAWSGTVTP